MQLKQYITHNAMCIVFILEKVYGWDRNASRGGLWVKHAQIHAGASLRHRDVSGVIHSGPYCA